MKWTLITGASSGIGEACAEKLAEKGHSLWLIARREDRLKTVAERLRKIGAQVEYTVLDVTNADHVHAWSENFKERLAGVDVLINNAGLAKGAAAFQASQEEEWRAMLETNVLALLRFTKLVLPHMIGRRAGHIVNLGSVAGRWAYTGGNVYCATKAAVHLLNQGLRYDLMGQGIRVTEILPGMVETEFSVVRFGDEGKARAVYEGMTPLTAADVADAVEWCLSRPAHVNIQEIVIYPTEQAAPGQVARRS